MVVAGAEEEEGVVAAVRLAPSPQVPLVALWVISSATRRVATLTPTGTHSKAATANGRHTQTTPTINIHTNNQQNHITTHWRPLDSTEVSRLSVESGHHRSGPGAKAPAPWFRQPVLMIVQPRSTC